MGLSRSRVTSFQPSLDIAASTAPHLGQCLAMYSDTHSLSRYLQQRVGHISASRPVRAGNSTKLCSPAHQERKRLADDSAQDSQAAASSQAKDGSCRQ